MAKRRIILPDDIKNLLTLAGELKQMKSVSDDHDKRIVSLETQEAPTLPIIAASASHSLIPKEPRPLPKDAAKQRKRPLLPIEIPAPHLPDPIKIEAFGRSVNDPTESISRKYMSASQLKQSGKKSPVV